jgi:hypothetical protein
MFDSKRFFAIGKHLALICATLLLLVTSVSSGRTSEVGNRLTAHVLRQAIGFRAQSLRRPSNAQTRVSKLDRSDAQSDRSSVNSGDSTELALLHAWQLSLQPPYRLLPPHTLRAIVLRKPHLGVDAERARAPPVAVASHS